MSADPDDSGGYAGEGFLSRWSRRKRLAAVDTVADPAPSSAVSGSSDGAVDAPAQAKPQQDERARCPETGEVIDEEWVARLPRIEDIQPGDDLSGFMRRGVPEALRRQALRRMWTTDPAIRDFVSPALDYAHDYNTPGAVPGFEPLTERELQSARAMVSRMFSAPRSAAADDPALAKGQRPDADVRALDPQDGPASSVVNSDMESQAGLDDPCPDDLPVSVRLSDVAVHQTDEAEVRVGPVIAPDEAANVPSRAGCGDGVAPTGPQTLVLHRSDDAGATVLSAGDDAGTRRGPAVRRRRGGGATPV